MGDLAKQLDDDDDQESTHEDLVELYDGLTDEQLDTHDAAIQEAKARRAQKAGAMAPKKQVSKGPVCTCGGAAIKATRHADYCDLAK